MTLLGVKLISIQVSYNHVMWKSSWTDHLHRNRQTIP